MCSPFPSVSADFTLTARFSDDDLAFCFVDIHNDLADLGHIDMSGQGIFNADDWSSESCLYLGALKAQIGFDHFAVYELQIFAVAKGLGAADSAVFKGDIFAVPRQVFTFHSAVSHGNVSGVPESVLRVEHAVFKNGIGDILKGIFAFHADIAEGQVIRAEHKIFAVGGAVLHGDTVHRPAEFR